MITKELLKAEIDKVENEYLELLYKIIKAFETSIKAEEITKSNMELNWQEFIDMTYGCFADAPIERGEQGEYEIREINE